MRHRTISYERFGGRLLTLNRPEKLNAWTPAVAFEQADAIGPRTRPAGRCDRHDRHIARNVTAGRSSRIDTVDARRVSPRVVPRSTDAARGDRALAARVSSPGRTRLALVIGVLAVAVLALLAVTARSWLRGTASPSVTGSAEKIAILPLGDSITEKFGKVSYRYWLWHGLHAAGWTGIEYLGSVKDPWANDFDPDHEGHGSWTAHELLHGRSDRPAEGNAETWFAGISPDVVLMLMGTNDLARRVCVINKRTCTPEEEAAEFRTGETEALDAMTGIVELARRRNPKVAIVLAQIPPNVWVPTEQVSHFDEEGIAALARKLTTPESPVFTVDLREGFVVAPDAPDSDTTDGVHPNFSGAKKIGARFQELLTSRVLPHVVEQRRAASH